MADDAFLAADAEDRRAALAAAALMASSRGDIGLHPDHDLHWLTLADEGYRWLRNHDTRQEKTMTEDAAAAEAAEDVTPAEGAEPAEEGAESEGAEAAEAAPEGAEAEDAGPAA